MYDDDIFLLADGTWCYRSELGTRSIEGAQILTAYSEAWDRFIERNGG